MAPWTAAITRTTTGQRQPALRHLFLMQLARFSVESTALGAHRDPGGHVGGMVNVVTKSGSNQYHGEAFEFIRNNYL